MKIYTQIDPQIIKNYRLDNSNLIIDIWWEHDGICYPMKNWSDFGFVLLGWWVLAMQNLIETDEETNFMFMDGSYALKAKLNKENGIIKLLPKGKDFIWEVKLIDLAQEIIRNTREIENQLNKIPGKEREKAAFERVNTHLQETISKMGRF